MLNLSPGRPPKKEERKEIQTIPPPKNKKKKTKRRENQTIPICKLRMSSDSDLSSMLLRALTKKLFAYSHTFLEIINLNLVADGWFDADK